MASSSTFAREKFLTPENRMSTIPSQHKIFLCHSGAQKNFVRHLHGELHRAHQFAFFDADDDSLRKGEAFPHQLFEAARQCQLAIVVLSEDFFTRSKWPMLELNIFMEEKKKIFPLFYDLSVVDLKDETRQAEWFQKWEEWSVRTSHSFALEGWKKNFEALRPTVGLERMRFDYNDVAFIEQIVADVCKMLPSYLKWDDSHMKGKDFFFSEIDRLFACCPPSGAFGARVIGLYGIGGLGKTTLCNSLCNHYYAEYAGKVSIVEFLGHDQKHIDEGRTLKSIHHVLRVLTGASDALLPNIYTKEQGFNVLRKRIPGCDVFLAIDNVWDDLESQEEASSFLQLGFTKASRVLVTARNRQTLLNLGVNRKCCFEMPTLLEKDAIDVFLHHAGVFQKLADLSPERQIYVHQHVYQCYFLKGTKKEFHPLALKVLGSRCKEILKNPTPTPSLKVVEFLYSEDAAREMFPILKTSIRALREDKYKLKFMDIALFYRDEMVMYHWPVEISATKLSEWLELIHEENQQKKFDQIETLKSKFLLEMDGGQGYKVHELYHEFARHEAQGWDLEDQKFLHINCTLEGFAGLPSFMMAPPLYNRWPLRRLYVANADQGWSKLNLQYFSNLGLLHLEKCSELTAELKATGLICLRHLRLMECKFKAVYGLHDLPNLVRMDLIDTSIQEAIAPEKAIWHRLQHLHLERAWNLKGGFNCPALKTMALKDCDLWPAIEGKNLRTLSVSHIGMGNVTLEDFPNLQDLHLDCVPNLGREKNLDRESATKEMNFWYSIIGLWKQIIGLDALRHLRELFLYSMKEVAALEGLQDCMELSKISVEVCDNLVFFSSRPMNWTSLQAFHVYSCNNLRIADVGPLPALKEISFGGLRAIRQLPDLSKSLSLQKYRIFDCPPDSVQTLDMGNSPFLVKFEVSNCRGLKTLANVGPLPSLKSFQVMLCPNLVELPDLTDSPALEEYEVRCCENLQAVGKMGPLPALRSFKVEGCDRLVEVLHHVNIRILEVFQIVGCQLLTHIDNVESSVDSAAVDYSTPSSSLFGLSEASNILNESEALKKDKTGGKLGPMPALRSFKVVKCKGLMELPDLTDSQALEEYEVGRCEKLKSVSNMGPVPALRSFKIEGCTGLVEVPDLTDSQALEVYYIQGCENLKTVSRLGPVPALKSFKIEKCNELVELPDLTNSQALNVYEVQWCNTLQNLGKLGPMPALRSFKVVECKGLMELPDLTDSQALAEYEVGRCENLKSVSNMGPVPALRSFKIEKCNELVELPDLTNSRALNVYEVQWCNTLQNLGKLELLPALRSFKVHGCSRLVGLPDLKGTGLLKEFEVRFCENLQTLGKMGPLPALESFILEGCSRLVELPHLVDRQALKVFKIISCPLLSSKGSLALECLTQAEPIPYGTRESASSSRVRRSSKLSACQCTIT